MIYFSFVSLDRVSSLGELIGSVCVHEYPMQGLPSQQEIPVTYTEM
jgi:hypothetical protein